MTQEVQPDRKDLKIQALRERIAQIVVEYEDKDADRRIVITEYENLINNLQQQLQDAQGTDVKTEEPLADDTSE